jgi:hypothetical protein
MNLAETASVAELLWVAIGLVAGAVNTVLWVIAVRDLKAVYAMRQNGAKRIEAWTWFWAHLVLVLTQSIAVGIGIFAALSPPANPATPTTTVGLVLVVGLIAKQLLNGALGVFLIFRRGKLDAYIDAQVSAVAVVLPAGRATVQESVDIVAGMQDEAARGGIPDELDAAELARRRAQADAEKGGHDD